MKFEQRTEKSQTTTLSEICISEEISSLQRKTNKL